VRRGAPEAELAQDIANDDHYVVLLHPVTRAKLRCAEDVSAYLSVVAQASSYPIEDGHGRIVSLSILFPTTAAGAVLVGVGATLIGLSLAPYYATRADTPSRLYERGLEAFQRGDDAHAIPLFELSAAIDPAAARQNLDLYDLGRAYHRSNRHAQALTALTTFVDGAIVWNRPAYDEAERLMVSLAGPPRACASTAPVRVPWP
jgi:hypothetical protein